MSLAEAGRTLADPTAYADEPRLHRALALLRRDGPLHWVRAPGYHPFWAVVRHADIREVERRHREFLSGPRPMLVAAELDAAGARGERRDVLRPLAHLDDPEHRVMRAVTADRFTPQSVSSLEPGVRRLARRAVERLRQRADDCEFVSEVSDRYALDVLCLLLGVGESDAERLFRFTPAGRRTLPAAERTTAMRDFYTFFLALAADRRRHPTDDLASVIANARVRGRLLDDRELLSQYVIMLTAGHDTASVTIAGGLRALVEHPEQWRRLREDPDLLPTAVDEMVRWVTPVKAFLRTAAEDCQLAGSTVRAGESLLLSYPSANRDEDVFDRPDEFDVGRTPNRQLAFGYGVHHCLGAALARLEIRAFFAELLPLLDSAHLTGAPELLRSTFSGGLKRLPVRCVFSDRAAAGQPPPRSPVPEA